MSFQAAVQSGAAKQSVMQNTKQSSVNKSDANFLGSISETLQGQLGSASIVSRNEIKDLGIEKHKRNYDEWGWPEEEDLVQGFIKKIERALSLVKEA